MDKLEDIRSRIEARMKPEYGATVEVGDGWLPIIDQLDRKLSVIDPDYVVYQVKEKFGGLRYYCSLEGNQEAAAHWIRDAESLCSRTCERCGSQANVTTSPRHGGFWIVTLCELCRKVITE